MSALLTSFEELKPGDVIIVEVMLRDRQDRDRLFPWKYFACVTKVYNRRMMEALRLQLDSAKWGQPRSHMIGTQNEKIFLVPDAQVPQGPAAIKMKMLAKGALKLGGGG